MLSGVLDGWLFCKLPRTRAGSLPATRIGFALAGMSTAIREHGLLVTRRGRAVEKEVGIFLAGIKVKLWVVKFFTLLATEKPHSILGISHQNFVIVRAVAVQIPAARSKLSFH